MKNLYFIFITISIFIITGCAPTNYKRINTNHISIKEIREIYNPFFEKGFCLKVKPFYATEIPDKDRIFKDYGIVYDVIYGGPFWTVIPETCDQEDIVMHTHPLYGEPVPNLWDFMMFEKYYNRHGNTKYGVYGFMGLMVYEREEDKETD